MANSSSNNDVTIATIALAVQSAIAALELAARLKSDLAQDAEMTPEQEAALDAAISNAPDLEHWKPSS